MSNRDRVSHRAELIYEFLRNRRETPHRKREVLDELGLNDSKTTRQAIARARELAKQDGLYLTIPVYENGYTMGLTEDPSAAVDPALWLARVETGVRVPKDIADEFMRERMSKLSASERAYIHLADRAVEANRSIQDAMGELVDALIEERRQSTSAG